MKFPTNTTNSNAKVPNSTANIPNLIAEVMNSIEKVMHQSEEFYNKWETVNSIGDVFNISYLIQNSPAVKNCVAPRKLL